jgi:cytochrome c oxidase subunit 2
MKQTSSTLVQHLPRGLRRWPRALAALALGLAADAAMAVNDLPGGPAVNQINLDSPASIIAEQQHWLHSFMLLVCLAIFVVVFGVMFYSILKHRKSLGHKAENFHESTTVEIAWTVVPFLIVIVMGAFATRTVVAMKDTSNPDLTIKVTGYQWKWGYDYLKGPGEGISFLSTSSNAKSPTPASPRATTTCSASITRWSFRSTARCA